MQTPISFDEDKTLKQCLLPEEAREAVRVALTCEDIEDAAYCLREISQEAYDRDPNHPRYDIDRFRFPCCTQEQIEQSRGMITPDMKIGAFLLDSE